MATKTPKPKPIILTFTIIIFLASSPTVPAAKPKPFARSLSAKRIGLGPEKLTHLHFFFHDIVSGRRPTAVRVAQAATTNASATGFGLVAVIDDPLTAGMEKGSRVVGRAQGLYGSADLATLGLLMVVNFVFTEGKFNGSALSVLGRNEVLAAVRELPIVGGTGAFRFARGYAHASTRKFNARGDAVVEYNVFVFHY